MIVEGAIFDAAGSRKGYVRFRNGRVVEVGQIGTDSRRGRERRIRGIVVPPPVNAHTHLADSIVTREPPNQTLEEIVEPPHGIKFRALAEATPALKRQAIRRTLKRMAREGIAATVDFREEGLAGVELFQAAARGTGVRRLVLGRPLCRRIDDQSWMLSSEPRMALALAPLEKKAELSGRRLREPAAGTGTCTPCTRARGSASSPKTSLLRAPTFSFT